MNRNGTFLWRGMFSKENQLPALQRYGAHPMPQLPVPILGTRAVRCDDSAVRPVRLHDVVGGTTFPVAVKDRAGIDCHARVCRTPLSLGAGDKVAVGLRWPKPSPMRALNPDSND